MRTPVCRIRSSCQRHDAKGLRPGTAQINHPRPPGRGNGAHPPRSGTGASRRSSPDHSNPVPGHHGSRSAASDPARTQRRKCATTVRCDDSSRGRLLDHDHRPMDPPFRHHYVPGHLEQAARQQISAGPSMGGRPLRFSRYRRDRHHHTHAGLRGRTRPAEPARSARAAAPSDSCPAAFSRDRH